MTTWYQGLSVDEFAYNSSVNRSTGLSSFEVVTGYRPGKPMNLLFISIGDHPNASADSFAQYLH